MFRFDRGGRPPGDLLAQAWEARRRDFPPVIRFDYPARTLAVSVTGRGCGLNCAHCGGHYLKAMTPIAEVVAGAAPAGAGVGSARNASAGGASRRRPPASYLISGGCDRAGRVPLDTCLPAIEALKATGARLNFHTGLVDEGGAKLAGRLADRVSFDMVGDDATIREVYGLGRTLDDYVAGYRALRRHARVMPHVCLGLRGGEWSGEENALRALEREGLDGLVFIVFIPTPGTRYAGRKPPPADEVASFIAQARLHFSGLPIYLGCMRPGGAYRAALDPLALRAGVNAIVQPARTAVALASALGLTVERGEECCAL
jgi:uncharacterized radical SAM superfamily protein